MGTRTPSLTFLLWSHGTSLGLFEPASLHSARELEFKFISLAEVHQGSFCDADVDSNLVQVVERTAGLLKLAFEGFYFVFQVVDVFPQGSLHQDAGTK